MSASTAAAVLNYSFDVSDITGQKRQKVTRVPIGTSIGELIRGLVAKMTLSSRDSEDRPLTYYARSDREGRHLLASELVADVVAPDDTIVLQPNVDAGLPSERRVGGGLSSER